MSECNCIKSTFVFYVFERPNKWWHKLPFVDTLPTATKILTIHGDTLKEIETKRDEIKNQLKEKYGVKYFVKVYVK